VCRACGFRSDADSDACDRHRAGGSAARRTALAYARGSRRAARRCVRACARVGGLLCAVACARVEARCACGAARICVHVAHCARGGAGGGVASLRVAVNYMALVRWGASRRSETSRHRRAPDRSYCPHAGTRPARTLAGRASPARTDARWASVPGPHGRSLGERPRAQRPRLPPLTLGAEMKGIRKGAAPVHHCAHGYNRGGSALLPTAWAPAGLAWTSAQRIRRRGASRAGAAAKGRATHMRH
jgi:hypothetical protein